MIFVTKGGERPFAALSPFPKHSAGAAIRPLGRRSAQPSIGQWKAAAILQIHFQMKPLYDFGVYGLPLPSLTGSPFATDTIPHIRPLKSRTASIIEG